MELETRASILVDKVEKLEQEKAHLEEELKGAQQRLTEQDVSYQSSLLHSEQRLTRAQTQLMSLTAQILSLRNAMTEAVGIPSVAIATTPFPNSNKTNPSPNKSLTLSTPPATPERPVFPFSLATTFLDEPDVFFESMESFRFPASKKERKLMRRRSAGAASSLGGGAGALEGHVQMRRRAGSADLRTLCTTSFALED